MAHVSLTLDFEIDIETRKLLTARFPDRDNPLKFIVASDEAVALFLLESNSPMVNVGRAFNNIPEEKVNSILQEIVVLETNSGLGVNS